MEALFLAITVGIVIYVGFVLLFPHLFPGNESKHTKHVLNNLYEENQDLLSDSDQSILQRNIAENTPFIRFFYGLPGMERMYELAMQAGYGYRLGINIASIAVASFIVALIVIITGLPSFLLLLAPIVGYFLVKIQLNRKIIKRNEKFVELFPDALDMIVRSVRSGFPLGTAIRMVAENIESPVKEEFQKVADEVVLGRPVGEAMARLALRINEPDIHFFVVVLAVQQETGGNLAEVISNLSSVIRKRKQLRLKIRAITSEGRTTSFILGALPILFASAMLTIDPNYLSPLQDTFVGNIIAGAIVGLTVGCYLVINKMVNIDI